MTVFSPSNWLQFQPSVTGNIFIGLGPGRTSRRKALTFLPDQAKELTLNELKQLLLSVDDDEVVVADPPQGLAEGQRRVEEEDRLIPASEIGKHRLKPEICRSKHLSDDSKPY